MSTSARNLFLSLALALLAGCGGAGGGPGPEGSGQGLVLLAFEQASQDTIPLNRVLTFVFSEPVDPASVTPDTIQIREGDAFGRTAAGRYDVQGSTVRFEPVLPSVCGTGHLGMKPATTYRVVVVGHPEEFAVRNTRGQRLNATQTREFRTLAESDPGAYEDARPGEVPRVLSITPAPGSTAVSVGDNDVVEIRLSENLDPCTVTTGLGIRMHAYEVGALDVFLPAGDGRNSGFDPIADSTPDDPYSWGGIATALAEPVALAETIVLEQDFQETLLRIRPRGGSFPENALVVIEVGTGVVDYGGSPLAFAAYAFTTENLEAREQVRTLRFDGSTPVDRNLTTTDVDTARSPDRAQAWLSFGGDGDNGPDPIQIPSWPTLDPVTGAYVSCEERPNDGHLDDFDPPSDVTLNTGSTLLPVDCQNASDGSQAVVWEFASFRIRTGVTVRIAGVNPAILLVNGDAVIEPGASLLLRGSDGAHGVKVGTNGSSATVNTAGGVQGGVAVAGGGPGGRSYSEGTRPAATVVAGAGGGVGFGSPGPEGAGGGGVSQKATVSGFNAPSSFGAGGHGGGGGGHGARGADGLLLANRLGSSYLPLGPVDGAGGAAYPGDVALRLPSAGSGGGGGGYGRNISGTAGRARYDAEGGGGGAGGGFLGLVASGSITVHGTLDASGGAGGDGGQGVYSCGGGGGGGAGGGLRLLTSGNIDLAGGSLLASGGAGGHGWRQTTASSGGGGPFAWVRWNDGGDGADGRIVLEDGDSVISGIESATVLPGEGQDGFWRSILDPSRFPVGSTRSVVVMAPFGLGAVLRPERLYMQALDAADVLAGIPTDARLPAGEASLTIEVQGYGATAEGLLDPATATGWYVAGFLQAGASANAPLWTPDVAPPGFVPEAGVGIANLDGRALFVAVRLSFALPTTMGPEDPGPWVEQLDLRFISDD